MKGKKYIRELRKLKEKQKWNNKEGGLVEYKQKDRQDVIKRVGGKERWRLSILQRHNSSGATVI